MTHTPGPWSVDRLGVVTGGPHFLTSVAETYATKWAHCQATSAHKHSQEAADYCGQMYEDAMANGRLIAAAPDLLEAAEAVLANAIDTQAYGPDDVDPDDWDGPLDEDGDPWFWDFWNLREAIAKAKGDDHA